MTKDEIFIKVPNQLFTNKYLVNHGLNKKYLVTYLFVARNRMYDNRAVFSLEEIADFYGVRKESHRPQCCLDAINALKNMESNGLIHIISPENYEKAKYDTRINIELTELFEPANKFTKLSYVDFEKFINSTAKEKEQSLFLYLFVLNQFNVNKYNTGLCFCYRPRTAIIGSVGIGTGNTYKAAMSFLTNEDNKLLTTTKKVGYAIKSNGQYRALPKIYIKHTINPQEEFNKIYDYLNEFYGNDNIYSSEYKIEVNPDDSSIIQSEDGEELEDCIKQFDYYEE